MIISGGNIHDGINPAPYVGDIRVENGKITAISEKIVPAPDEEILDVSGKEVFPGLVEAHCHTGMETYGQRKEGNEVNEHEVVCPQLRAIDGFNPFDPAIRMALESGVTTICTGPGSRNVLGGTFLVTKTAGTCIDDMVLIPDVAMKCAFGENPKFANGESGCFTRMGVASKLRTALAEAQDYMLRKEAAEEYGKRPKVNVKYEALIPVLKGEMPLKAHCHRAEDICTAIRIAEEFGVKLTIEHCTEGYKITEKLAQKKYPVAVGPMFSDSKKLENSGKKWEAGKILSEAGLQVSLITDAPVTPLNRMALNAQLFIQAGMDPFAALQAVTINPARHIGVADRVGSLEVGKDADVVIAEGELLNVATKITAVLLDGKPVVDNR